MFIMSEDRKDGFTLSCKSFRSRLLRALHSQSHRKTFANQVSQVSLAHSYGFTLTEVIVVIVIIAALAIILIPNMLSLMPDDHNIKYKKAFYTIQEIVNDIANDCQGLKRVSNNWDDSGVNSDNVLNYCYGEKQVNGNPVIVSRYLAHEICTRLNTTTDCGSSVDSNDGGKNIQTTNGMYWYLPNQVLSESFENDATIYVNVDNKTMTSPTATNSDNGTYRILVTKTGKVKTPGNPESGLLMDNPTKD